MQNYTLNHFLCHFFCKENCFFLFPFFYCLWLLRLYSFDVVVLHFFKTSFSHIISYIFCVEKRKMEIEENIKHMNIMCEICQIMKKKQEENLVLMLLLMSFLFQKLYSKASHVNLQQILKITTIMSF